MEEAKGFQSSPNEIIISILSIFGTKALLPMALVSKRFHSLIVRILERRLQHASSLRQHTLILECYHPSTKLSTPYLFCEHLGTGTCDHVLENVEENTNEIGRLGEMKETYSHFRPLQPDEDRLAPRRHPAGGWLPGPSNGLAEKETEYVCQDMHLESHELFSQLCTVVNLVKVGPKRGLFLSSVNIGEDIIRIFRNWLAERGAETKKRNRLGSGPATKEAENEESRKRLLWAGRNNNIGLRLKAIEKQNLAAPILISSDEDTAVSYTLQYEELVIRNTHLLLMVEQSIDQEINHSGKAIVIGSWDQ